jgi:hypothetical protein
MQEYNWLNQLLHQAYLEARKNKRNTVDEQRFERNAPIYLAELAREIQDRTYNPSHGIAFIVRKPVIREIFAAPFRDRVVHHFIYRQVADYWDHQFIHDNYSCRKGKGNLFGIRRLNHHIRSVSANFQHQTWVLKLDIQGYFMSLSRKKLYEAVVAGLNKQFRPNSREYKTLKFLWRKIIFDDPTDGVKIRGNQNDWQDLPKSKSLFWSPSGRGIVIGNLTSQLLSNIYLNQLDQFVYFNLGFKHYGRYVDDFYLVSRNKTELLDVIPKIEDFLRSLELTLHPKKRVLREINQGIEFLGAVIYPYRIQPGKRIKKGYYNTIYQLENFINTNNPDNSDVKAKLDRSLASYQGLTKHYKHQKMLSKGEQKLKPPNNAG